MDKKELLDLLLAHTNLDSSQAKELERFFSERDDITVENFTQLFNEWRNSDDGKQAAAEIEDGLSKEKDAELMVGLSSIWRGDYKRFRPDSPARKGTHVVIDNITRLRGLLSEDGEEILPCIFDDVDVKLSGYLEVHFKGRYYAFMILSKDFKPRIKSYDYDFSGGAWGYYRLDEYDKYEELDETTRQLVSLLSVRHAPNPGQ